MNKNQFAAVRRSLTYQITEIKALLKRDSEIKDEEIKLTADERLELEESRRKLVLSYRKAKIARINNQGKMIVSEIISKKGNETALNPKVASKLDAMSKKVYSLEYLPVRKPRKKTKKKSGSLFDS